MSKNQTQSHYRFESEGVAGMRRAAIEDAMLTDVCTPLLAPNFPDGEPATILDIACGPGVWSRKVAQAYPQVQVTGIDNRQLVIDYAQMAAENHAHPNVSYQKADFYHLDRIFAPEQFDFINVRQVLWYLGNAKWDLVQHWETFLKPKGMMRLTDWEVATTNSPAYNRLTRYFLQALYARGYLPGEYCVGIVSDLFPLLQRAGFEHIIEQPHYLNLSAGTSFHDRYVQDVTQVMISLEDFIVSSGVDRQTYRLCRQQSIKELDHPHFHGSNFYLSAWGIKRSPLCL